MVCASSPAQMNCSPILMRTIEETRQFRRDLKRELKGRHSASVLADLRAAIEVLIADMPLDGRYHDHALAGNWRDHRDCHLKPDLVLIYTKPKDVLRLVRLGSHAEMFG